MNRFFGIFVCMLLSGVSIAAQTPARTASTTINTVPARTHVERFSTPEMRAERGEAEASAKLAANPKDAEALDARSLARVRLGRYQEALEDLRRAAALKPSDADNRASIGYVQWRLGRAAEAIESERVALKLDEKNFTAHYHLGRFIMRMGDQKLLPEAVMHLRRAVELNPRQYDVRLELIAAYRLVGDTASALAQLNLLEDARPSDARIIYVRALLAADRRDMNAAINGLREALNLDPTLSGAWQDLGLAYLKLKRWPEAVETFERLARSQADSVDAAYFYALALFNAGHTADAEREVRRALRLDAGAAAAHTLLGIILASRGHADAEASDALAQAIALDPQSFDARFYLGRVQYATKDYDAAAKNLHAAVELNPRHAEARFFLGTTLEAAGKSEEAFEEYQELVRVEPDSTMGQVGLGALLIKQGKVDEAISSLKRAVALDPQNFEAHLALGRAFSLSERFADAADALSRATALMPFRAEAHYQLGLALQRVGRKDEAAHEFKEVERLNTEFRTGLTKPE